MCGREDMEHQWIYDRCREVQEAPNGFIDLWAREHYKSTVITFGKTLQDILGSHGDNPIHDKELTFGIFSHNRPTAVKFIAQLKHEMEGNRMLRSLFPDVLWESPGRDAPKWSVYAGLVVKRKRNAKEATLEGYGLVDGMPTGAHFDVLVYDDVVTVDVARSTDMMEKVTDATAMSYNLGARGGERRMIGTRYHYLDTYGAVMKRNTFTPRIHTATEDSTETGVPVLLTSEELATKRRDQGPYVFASQMLQDPQADSTQGFKEEWLRYYNDVRLDSLNLYFVVDPANEKKKRSDYTSMWCIGLGEDNNYYAVDMLRDRLSLTERARKLMQWHRKYRPIGVGYEEYGMQADIEHVETVMELEGYRFEITPLAGALGNNDRVRRLIPIFEQARMWLPVSKNYTDWEGTTKDMVEIFREEEYKPFPVGLHPDMLDSLSRILDDDMEANFPSRRQWAPIEYPDGEFPKWVV